MELVGKVALVTGGGSGIGRASARALAAAGAVVGVLGHGEEQLREAVAEIEADGGRAVALLADVTDEAAMRTAVQQLVDQAGRLDVVFANAGINGVWAPIDDLTPQEWDRTIAVNLRGTYLTLHCAVPYLKRNGGSIIITSSINGTRTFSNPGTIAYAATKAGQVAMAQILALELAKHRIRVNVVCPGAIGTEISDNTSQRNLEEAEVKVDYPEGEIPLTGGEKGAAEEVADLVLFLASDRSRHITGTPIWIDGGESLIV
ncbi:SDR family oxidoreductase [Chthonobacter rhizosphaerae]|uniref:SDR family oxidoreductase n=1 Tax=Chthonobacter rhizosphaerae TaxID=2735553 RepID=UPI0015EF88E3|nr:SDR family NAD(P)-dependent oxidoreductase [Chthonobacter rhizosphaerae]